MARSKNFEREEKLIQAMELFWQKGYAETSMADLVAHLGINRFSIYNSYIDKESLYQEALAYYLNNVSLPALTALRSEQAGAKEVIHFLSQFAQLQHEQTCGCFLQNALLERAYDNKPIRDKANDLFLALEQAFLNALTNDQQKGLITPAADISQLSRFLVMQMQGIRVLGKARQYDVIQDALAIVSTTLNSYRIIE
ncbi:TetR/AcrR family transcriptional regulator [Photobacterium minamisatsumaniensis]|uniref:TetR/AcrR family transcriptional regulator n=1 Tax=Photobacterium minamisatsumaniensis TaxID=2910233 RepID=UPI003D119503